MAVVLFGRLEAWLCTCPALPYGIPWQDTPGVPVSPATGLYARVSHLRQYRRHKASTAIAKRGGTMQVETLNIAGMDRNSPMLEYKVRVEQYQVRQGGPLVPVKPSLLLSERT